MLSTFSELSFSFNFLRTTLARKPRTECGCQPVAVIIAPIVALGGDCSIAITRDCFDPGLAFSILALPIVPLDCLIGGVDDLDFAGDRPRRTSFAARADTSAVRPGRILGLAATSERCRPAPVK